MLLVARGLKTRAHGACVEFPAVSVVVAHLHGFRKTARAIAAAARMRDGFAARIVLYVPLRPVESRRQWNRPIRVAGRRRRKAKQRTLIHPRGVDDSSGIEQVDGIEMPFDGTKGIVDRGPELPLYPFASAQTVAVLPAVRTLVLAHQGRGFFGNGPHLGGTAARTVAPHVQNRAHVKR